MITSVSCLFTSRHYSVHKKKRDESPLDYPTIVSQYVLCYQTGLLFLCACPWCNTKPEHLRHFRRCSVLEEQRWTFTLTSRHVACAAEEKRVSCLSPTCAPFMQCVVWWKQLSSVPRGKSPVCKKCHCILFLNKALNDRIESRTRTVDATTTWFFLWAGVCTGFADNTAQHFHHWNRLQKHLTCSPTHHQTNNLPTTSRVWNSAALLCRYRTRREWQN